MISTFNTVGLGYLSHSVISLVIVNVHNLILYVYTRVIGGMTITPFKACLLKGATITTRAESKWGGVMIKLSGLSPCLLYSVFYFNSVVCRLLSVSY